MGATIEIPKDVLQPIIEARVTAALSEALAGDNKQNLLEMIVDRVLSAKVDDRGEPDRYNSSHATTALEWMVRKALKEAVSESIKEALQSHKETLREALVAELQRSKSKLVQHLARSMVEGMAKTAESASYRFSVEYKERE
jgi:hypothetical protein